MISETFLMRFRILSIEDLADDGCQAYFSVVFWVAIRPPGFGMGTIYFCCLPDFTSLASIQEISLKK